MQIPMATQNGVHDDDIGAVEEEEVDDDEEEEEETDAPLDFSTASSTPTPGMNTKHILFCFFLWVKKHIICVTDLLSSWSPGSRSKGYSFPWSQITRQL